MHGHGPRQRRGLCGRCQRDGSGCQPVSRDHLRRLAVAEFLGALDDDDPTADRKPPKVISLSDPCSAWTAKANKRVQFGYGLNYLIDIENAVIVDVEATPARTYDEVAAARTMIERTEQRMGLKP